MGGLGCGLMRTGVWFWDGNDWVWVKGSHIQTFGGYATCRFSGQSARRLSNDHHTASAASKIRCGLARVVVFRRRSSILSLDGPAFSASTAPTHPASTFPRSALLTTPPTKQQPTQPIYHPHHRSTHALALTHRPSTFPTHKVSASPSRLSLQASAAYSSQPRDYLAVLPREARGCMASTRIRLHSV